MERTPSYQEIVLVVTEVVSLDEECYEDALGQSWLESRPSFVVAEVIVVVGVVVDRDGAVIESDLDLSW